MKSAIPSSSSLHHAANADKPLLGYHELIQSGDQILNRCFEAGENIEELVHTRAEMIDAVIIKLWEDTFSDCSHPMSLVAVGGYGRGELHPYSDVDIMLLISTDDVTAYGGKIESFITLLWDLGMDVGHSVRTLDDVVTEATKDITVITNLMEGRLLKGDQTLFKQMKSLIEGTHIWPIQDFYHAKLAEQEGRYKKFDDHAYRLEPNIKDGPGGLRDIQNIAWVAKRFYGVETLTAISDLGFFTQEETMQLMDGRALLWKIRWGLHILSKRGENRLLFDKQRQLAELFGFEDTPERQNLAVENFMQAYYRTVIRLERLNEMLLHILKGAIFPPKEESITTLNDRFVIKNGYLSMTDPSLFEHTPSALLEVFELMQDNPDLEGVDPNTIRQIRANRECIDDEFRQDKSNQQRFLGLLKREVGVTREFRRMNRYGILARYLPEFGHLVGRMQFDLYHIYTVDQHTIAVLGNSRIFTIEEGRKRFPAATEIYYALPKPELLHLSALFHDIGKGHGGDHSEIGADIARAFCQNHDMSAKETNLICWLVKHHLTMSMTTQRKDISDPQVIQDFAELVGDQVHLDYLYLLTLADINGTNPKLWTEWKASLLKELYKRTTRALRRGAAHPLESEEIVSECKEKVFALLEFSGLSKQQIKSLWDDFPMDYFLRHSPDEIAWQTQSVLKAKDQALPFIAIRDSSKRGGTPIFIYSDETDDFFAYAAITLDRMGLNVVDARIISTNSGKTLDTFIVLEQDNQQVTGETRHQEIINALKDTLNNPDSIPHIPEQRIPRVLKQFDIKTQVELSSSPDNNHTVVEIFTADRPGLLAHIGKAFIECDVRVHNAKINTIGEQVDDVFFITDEQNQALGDPNEITKLVDKLYEHIDHDRPTPEKLRTL